MKIKFDAIEFQKRIDKKTNKIIELVEKELEQGANNIASKADELAPIHDSDLVNSIDYKQTEKSAGKIVYQIFANAPHAASVEFGTKPHYVSAKHLKKWAKDKLGDENLAYAVAKKIARRGTKAQPFLRPSYFLYEYKIKQNVKNAVAKGLKSGGGSK